MSPSTLPDASHHKWSDEFLELMMIIACTICLETFLSTPFLSPLLFFLVFAFSFLIFILCLFLVSCLSAVLHAFTLWKIALWKKASVFKFSENNTTVVQPLWIISCCCKGWFFYFSLVWSYECIKAYFYSTLSWEQSCQVSQPSTYILKVGSDLPILLTSWSTRLC